MIRATAIVRKAAVRPASVVDTLTLDHAGRTLAVSDATTEGGLAIAIALPKAATLEDGDALRLEDGRLVAVRAAGEPLLEVRAGNPARLMRLAWQLGGSHVAAEIGSDVLHVPANPAVAELIRGQGCTATAVTRPFRPEREAHDHSQCGHDHHDHAHGHAQGHAHSHAHADGRAGVHDHAHDHERENEHASAHAAHKQDDGHAHDHAHEHAHGHVGGHVHGPGCKHDH